MTRMTRPARRASHIVATGFAQAIFITLMSAMGATTALAKDGFKVGGYFTQSVSLVDIDDRPGFTLEDEVLTQNAEFHVAAQKTLDNGLRIGAHIQLEGATESDQIDEHYVSLRADWGQILLGAENGVGHLMQVRAPSFVPGLKMYDNSLTDEGIERAYDALLGDGDDNTPKVINDAHMSTKLEQISGDANKVSLITPKVGGAQFGLSFAPNNKNRGGSVDNLVALGTNELVQDDIIEMAVSYSGRVGGVKYKFGYSSVGGTTLGSTFDPESNSTGVRVGWGDYVVGANVSIYENLDQVDAAAYAGSKIETQNISLRKRNGSSQIGLGWTTGDENERNGDRLTEYEEWMVGGGRKIGEGVQLGYYYAQMTVDRPQADGDAQSAEISTLGLTLDIRF